MESGIFITYSQTGETNCLHSILTKPPLHYTIFESINQFLNAQFEINTIRFTATIP